MSATTDTSSRLGIEQLSVFGLPPGAFVNLVADLGCSYLSTGLSAARYNPHGYELCSLRDDPALRREMLAAMRDRGVSISLVEGLIVREGEDVRDFAADLDVMAELGAPLINAVGFDPDLSRCFDQFGVLAEMAAAAGIETTTEFVPIFPIADLPTAIAAVRHVGRPDFGLLIDTMHLARSGSGAADLVALDPNLIRYVQLCDAPLVPTVSSYLEEAMFERKVPGEGELPLRDILSAVPPHVVVGVEIPLRAQAEAGVGPEERLRPCVDAARALLARE